MARVPWERLLFYRLRFRERQPVPSLALLPMKQTEQHWPQQQA